MTSKQNNFAHTATFWCSSLALWGADHLQQRDVFNWMGRATAKKVPVTIPNTSVCTIISALPYWDHPWTGMFILPSCSICPVSFATCSSRTPRGCTDFSPKLLEISSEVLRHSSLLPFRPHEGDCVCPWDSDPLHLTSSVSDGTRETDTSS